MEAISSFFTFCDELFSDVSSTHYWRTFVNNTLVSRNMSIAKDFTFQRPSGLITSSGQAERKNLTGYNLGIDLKSCDNNNNLRSSCRRDGNVKRKKSVSFEEDVVVYLFDQESPTLRLLSETCTSLPKSFSSNLPAVTSENSDLQWEDDFSVLEKACCVQCARHFHTIPLPTRDRTAPSRPDRSSLSQSCLFLTYVTESDLEL